ncbi:DUF7544 domain-containing protein [Halovivax cerinus]|uniref:Membrane domain of glycerophosphoryl diester phosphodiesterase n=1 Tax=Halovivax cerinus TaxID=1487865 RepID=A0ABD5NKE6_9EURY|nr:hypothetical protein [Halovivax cerinus]
MYAIDDLGDAIDVTRDFLTPIDVVRWLKLAVVVFFVGGAGGFSPTSFTTGDPTGTGTTPTEPSAVDWPSLTPDVIAVLALMAAIVLTIWIVFGVLGSTLEFVLIDSMRSGSVSILSGLGSNLWRGVRLFVFRAVLGLLSLVLVGVPAYYLVWPIDQLETISFSTIGQLIALAVVVFFVYAIVSRLTTEFVVPTMVADDRGVLSAWGRFWTTLRGNPGEYVLYLVLVTVVSIAASIGLGILMLIVSFLVAIPFVIVGVMLVMLGEIGLFLLVPLAVLGFLAIMLVSALINMPLVVFVRYYALLVLGDTDPDLDLIPDRRRAVRTGADWDDGNSWAGDGDDPDTGSDDWGTDSGPDWSGPTDDDGADDADGGWGGTDDGPDDSDSTDESDWR